MRGKVLLPSDRTSKWLEGNQRGKAPTKSIANAYFLPDESQHTLPGSSKEIIVTNFPKINKS